MMLKIEHFLLKIIFSQVFARTMPTFGFRYRIVSKLLVFGVNILLETSTKILMITKLRN